MRATFFWLLVIRPGHDVTPGKAIPTETLAREAFERQNFQATLLNGTGWEWYSVGTSAPGENADGAATIAALARRP